MNNYTKNITFAKASNNPKYMQLLSEIVARSKRGKDADRAWYVKKVWGEDLSKKSHGWNMGPFTLLRQNLMADFKRRDKTAFWHATDYGIAFYDAVARK